VATTQNPGTTDKQTRRTRPPGTHVCHLPVVEIDPRTGYDFLTSACNDCGELEDLLPDDRAGLRSRGQDGRRGRFGRLRSNCSGFVAELGRILIAGGDKTARDVVDAIDAMTDAEFAGTDGRELIADPNSARRPDWPSDGDRSGYAETPDQARILQGQPRPDPADVGPAPDGSPGSVHSCLPLRGDRGARGADAGRDVAPSTGGCRARPDGFVERATNGTRLVPELEIRRIVLAPTYFGRPYNSLTKVGDVQLICYPISDASLGCVRPRDGPLRPRGCMCALGDASRLRILRLLVRRIDT